MTLKLHELSPSDPVDRTMITGITRVYLGAWLINELYEAVHDQSSSHVQIFEANRRKHPELLTSDARSHYAVVLDVGVCGDDRTGHNEQRHPEPDQVIAWVKYDIFQSQKTEEDRQDTGEIKYPPHTNQPLIHPIQESIVASRQHVGKSLGAYVSVDQLATAPDHDGRGAGRMLLEHIMKKADELGLPTALDASPQAMNLYTSVGFESVDEFWVDLLRFEGGRDRGEGWSKDQNRVPGQGAGWYKHVAMIRQPQKASSGVCSRDEVGVKVNVEVDAEVDVHVNVDRTGGSNELGNPRTPSPWAWLDSNY